MPSQWGEGTECLLERVSEARAGKSTQRASALQRNSLREGERKKEKERQGDKALMEQRCFNQHDVGIYTIVILSKIKIKIPDLQNIGDPY